MSRYDDELLEQARLRAANGNDTSLDRWRLRAAERREERTMTRDTNALDTSPGSAEAWNEWFTECFDDAVRTRLIESIGEAMAETAAELRADYSERLRELELQIARLEGELNVRRGARKSDVVDLPKMDWRRGNAA
jgi:hypothetical protein